MRSVLKYAGPVWHTSLTIEHANSLKNVHDRPQKQYERLVFRIVFEDDRFVKSLSRFLRKINTY